VNENQKDNIFARLLLYQFTQVSNQLLNTWKILIASHPTRKVKAD
jgi:hypothetical protein